jgi:hypothetical protein
MASLLMLEALLAGVAESNKTTAMPSHSWTIMVGASVLEFILVCHQYVS